MGRLKKLSTDTCSRTVSLPLRLLGLELMVKVVLRATGSRLEHLQVRHKANFYIKQTGLAPCSLPFETPPPFCFVYFFFLFLTKRTLNMFRFFLIKLCFEFE